MTTKSNERLVIEALEKIFGRTVKVIVSDGKIIQWLEAGESQPSTEQIQTEIQKIIDEEPMELLRKERDRLLSVCDWRVAPDYPNDDQELWKIYRQSLRDLPGKVDNGEIERPSIDSFGELVFNSWPSEPN